MTAPAQLVTIGRYEIRRAMGRGAFCAVYEGIDRETGNRVALKQLLRAGPVSLMRFKREFRSVQGIHHPNLVELHELFDHDGSCVIAMELIQGVDLNTYLQSYNDDRKRFAIRLRDAFQQLTKGLTRLHSAGVVHRDLKPRNVLVTDSGRVVLLDFGLVMTLGDDVGVDELAGIGSAEYMAPEQATGTELSAAADFYALGVCLYQALTGQLPITCAVPFELLKKKQSEKPLRPSARVADIPEDLDSLCIRLLAHEPRDRPGSDEVARVFGCTTVPSYGRAVAFSAGDEPAFTGREKELKILEDRLNNCRQGRLELVLIEGESGIGKSTLIHKFLNSLKDRNKDALILYSRCYENEQLAYKAFDSGMERLADFLDRLNSDRLRDLLPPQAALLPRVLSSFSRVKAIAKSPTHAIPADPTAQHLEGRHALLSLLAKIGNERPLVIAIDDLQWADAESFDLLGSLYENRTELSCLIICTLRPLGELEQDAAAAIIEIRDWPKIHNLVLHGLSVPTARTLASRLLGPDTDERMLDRLIAESQGHPLFLTELVRYVEDHKGLTAGGITLETALQARIDGLLPQARRLLIAACVAGRSYPLAILATATGLGTELSGLLSTQLLAQKLLRRRRSGELACFHDRIRQIAAKCVSKEKVRDLHAAFARALAQHPDCDSAQLARHYDVAGEFEAAISAYDRAGERALATLAFARAERLYSRALELSRTHDIEPERLHGLKVQRGHALARDGRSAEAAHQYLDAVDGAVGEARFRLRIWAAQHLLQSAQVEAGSRIAEELLHELGIDLPRNDASTLAKILWDRARISFGKTSVETASTRKLTTEDRMCLDAMLGLAYPISWIKPLIGHMVNMRYLRIALQLGEPGHVARALAQEAQSRIIRRFQDRLADSLFNRAYALSQKLKDASIEMFIANVEGSAALFRWDLELANQKFEYAEQLGTKQCPDQSWLLKEVRTKLSTVWGYQGEHARLICRSDPWRAEANFRNDQFAIASFEGLGFGFLRYLMRDEPDTARDALAKAMDPWPNDLFTFAHYGELFAIAHIEFYRGKNFAHEWLQAEMPRLRRTVVLKTALGKASLLRYQAIAALLAWIDAPARLMPGFIKQARSSTKRLARIDLPIATHSALLLEAQLDAVQGRVESALKKARRLAGTDTRHRWFLHPQASYLEGLLEGGDNGHVKQERALKFFADQGWQKPHRAVAIYCPLLDWLEAKKRAA